MAILNEVYGSESDEALFERFRDGGDRAALAALVERHVETVGGVCARIVPAQLADEAVQETFVQAIRHARGFRRGGTFKKWLIGIAVNSCRRAARQERQTVARENVLRNDPNNPMISGSATAADSEAVKGELLGALDACLREFSLDERTALMLHYGHGMTQAEVATVLKRPKGTVGSWLSGGLEKLRGLMRERGHAASDQSLALLLITAPALSAAARAGALQAAATVKPLPALLVKGTLSMKIALASAAAIAAVALISAGQHGFGADGATPPKAPPVAVVPAVTVPAIGTPDSELSDILKTKVTVSYHSEYLLGIVLDLWGRTGLHGVYPMPIRREHVYTFNLKEKTVREVLERVAADGGLQLEFRGHTVVFWKKAADGVIADLEKQLHSSDVWERVTAVHNLGNLGDKRAYSMLFNLVGDADEAVANEAIERLFMTEHVVDGPHGRILRMVDGADAHVDTLMKGLTIEKIKKGGMSANNTGRLTIIESLDGSCARQFLRQLVNAHAISNYEETDEQIQASPRLMAQRGLRRDVEKLLEIVNGPDKKAAVTAMCALEDYGCSIEGANAVHDTRIAPAIIKFAKDPDPLIRMAAADALCKTRDPRALETVFGLLSDPVGLVRYEASLDAYNLPNIDSRTIERIAYMAENETDINVRHPAAVGLSMIADDFAVQRMVELLGSPKPEVRTDFCDLVGPIPGTGYFTHRIDDPTVAPALLKLTRDEARIPMTVNADTGKTELTNDEVRFHALAALGSFPCRRVAEELMAVVLLPDEKLDATESDYYASAKRQRNSSVFNVGMNYYTTNGTEHFELKDYEFIKANSNTDSSGDYDNKRLMDARAWGIAAQAWVRADPDAKEKILSLPGEHPILLGMLGVNDDPRIIQRLLPLTKSANAEIRLLTAGALGGRQNRRDLPRAIAALTELAKDGDPHVSEAAAFSLLQFARSHALVNVPELVLSIPDPTAKQHVQDMVVREMPDLAKTLPTAKSNSTAVGAAGTTGAAEIASPGDVSPETKKSREAMLNAAKDEARKKIKAGLEKALAKHPQVSPEMKMLMRSSQVQDTWLKIVVDGAFSVCAKPVSDAQFAGACESIRRMRETGTGIEGDAFIDDYVSKSIEASIPANPAKPGDAGKAPPNKKKEPIVNSNGIDQLP